MAVGKNSITISTPQEKAIQCETMGSVDSRRSKRVQRLDILSTLNRHFQ